MLDDYEAFLSGKAPRPRAVGVEPTPMPAHLFDYQVDVTGFLLRQGCGAAFLDTGLGKTAIELEWCKQAAVATNGCALILTPLAVARQIEREGLRFGYDVRVVRDASEVSPGINICNYDRLDLLNSEAFGAVALDESSILKSFNGATTRKLMAFLQGKQFRLCATATPAPNDHMELGQHAEALGIMPSNEMLMRWFIADQVAMGRYVLKSHGEADFWDWMASWACCAESPADLGYDATRFVLPALNIIRHRAAGDIRAPAGELFAGDVSATNMHAVKRQTAEARADLVGELVNAEPDQSWVIWCDTDYEADPLVKRLPNAADVRGSHTIEKKESRLADFAEGRCKFIVTKPSVAGQGMNWQHAARVAFVGRSFSYEAWYQAVRRCWRFGQTRPVDVHIIVAEGEDQIGRVIERKAADHATMKRAMAKAMKRRRTVNADKIVYNPTFKGVLPTWLISAV